MVTIKKFIKILKDTISSIKDTPNKLLIFEFIFKIMTTLCLVPIMAFLFDFVMKITGYNYITSRNVLQCLQNPKILLILLLILLIFSYALLMEISTLTLFYGHKFENNKVFVRRLFLLSLRQLKKIFKPKNIGLVFYVACLIPIFNFVNVMNYLFSHMEISSYVYRQLLKNPIIMILVLALLCGFVYFVMRYLFVFCFFFLDRKSLSQSYKKSVELSKGREFKIIGCILCANVLYFIFYFLIYAGILAIVTVGAKLFGNQRLALAIFLSVFNISNTTVLWIIASLEMVTNICMIVHMYLRFTKKKKRSYTFVERKDATKRFVVNTKRMMIIIGTIVLVVQVVAMYMVICDGYDLLQVQQTKVTSHRGSSVSAPENSLSSIHAAVEDMADYAEIDVQETKDGIIVLFHDSNTKRITGKKWKIYKKNYEDLLTLDIGKWFSEEFEGERIPTLDEVMKVAKGKIKLNIELKPSGTQKDFEKKVVEVIEENGFEDDCIISSFSYSSLTKIKKMNHNIKTGYILSAVYGNYYDLEYADFFSLEQSFVNEKVVVEIHKRGKEVHVWTVNDKKRMEELAQIGVDSIITDDPVKARNVIYSRKFPIYSRNLLNLIFDY